MTTHQLIVCVFIGSAVSVIVAVCVLVWLFIRRNTTMDSSRVQLYAAQAEALGGGVLARFHNRSSVQQYDGRIHVFTADDLSLLRTHIGEYDAQFAATRW
jgi:hypothetical protein